eukprot:2302485-Amphidinium_carterae.1
MTLAFGRLGCQHDPNPHGPMIGDSSNCRPGQLSSLRESSSGGQTLHITSGSDQSNATSFNMASTQAQL